MKWKLGERAIGVTCRGCGRKIPLLRAAGDGVVEPDKIVVTCGYPTCHREHEYQKSDLQRFTIQTVP